MREPALTESSGHLVGQTMAKADGQRVRDAGFDVEGRQSALAEREKAPRAAAEERPERAEPVGADPLDPMVRVLGDLLPPATAAIAIPVPGSTLDRLAQEMLKRISLSGDGRRGTIRMEFGSGLMGGGSLLVDCDGDTIHVLLEPPGEMSDLELDGLILGLKTRLALRGLDVTEFEIRR